MKNNGIVKFLVVYFIAKAIILITGLSYNVFNEEFNLIRLIMDLAIWLIAYVGVSLVFSKLLNKQKNVVE
ncbi:hypothetical protein KQI88_10935 [Alkaliphilus sp. MSJ-5]|uniref:Uncharacterized protein n=1 Tax=Alkaliphilus flagellatus TaxID=2841507 RepID=A0ABS6G463_9FIRM|nr:hypothetical protein [Alkaliphilus flagellatus]MBU5676931.1 hypothetical protein [Alkaliphilus flagellatus]